MRPGSEEANATDFIWNSDRRDVFCTGHLPISGEITFAGELEELRDRTAAANFGDGEHFEGWKEKMEIERSRASYAVFQLARHLQY